MSASMMVFFLKTDFQYLQLFLREGEESVYFCYLPVPIFFLLSVRGKPLSEQIQISAV